MFGAVRTEYEENQTWIRLLALSTTLGNFLNLLDTHTWDCAHDGHVPPSLHQAHKLLRTCATSRKISTPKRTGGLRTCAGAEAVGVPPLRHCSGHPRGPRRRALSPPDRDRRVDSPALSGRGSRPSRRIPAEPQGKPKNTEVGSLSLFQWIFPTQESNQGLLPRDQTWIS